jgi:hypothetical protein
VIVMSNRRKLTRQAAQQLLEQSAAEDPVYVTTMGTYEMWAKGRVMFGVPVIREDYPAELKTALARRRRAMLDGQCECGARVRASRAGTEVRHEHDCIASDDSLDGIAERHGARSLRLPADAFGSPWEDASP